MSTWRNRYTRTFEGRVGKPVRVQVPPSTIKKSPLWLFLIGDKRTLNPNKAKPLTGSSGFADGRHEVSPDSEEIELG